MRSNFQSRQASLLLATAAFLGGAPALAQTPAAPAAPVVVPVPVPIPTDQTRPPDVVPGSARSPALLRPSVISRPTWLRSPEPEYPATALAAGVNEGRVTLTCLTTPQGSLTRCRVDEETPPALGFAEAAMTSAAWARISPRVVDGVPEAALVSFTVRFLSPEPAPPPPSSGR